VSYRTLTLRSRAFYLTSAQHDVKSTMVFSPAIDIPAGSNYKHGKIIIII
jgi:hypothetical protein